MFTKKDLHKLIIPLVIEQFLAVSVGMADTIMITCRGEEAVSGISIVDSISILLIGLFTALATGGAVVTAQYLGHKEREKAKVASNQLVLCVGIISLIIMGITLVGNEAILKLIYGDVDPLIMKNARLYFFISSLSYPFIALYNAGAALFRAMGNSKVSMKVSLCMNIINIVGNAILIYVCNMGVEGAAIPTLFSRIIAAVIVIGMLMQKKYEVGIDSHLRLGYQPKMIQRILRIGIPNGLENSMFQFGKILVGGLVASFGTISITANAVGNTVSSFNCIPGTAIGLAMITVVGQCVGAGELVEAKKYTKKLLFIAYVSMFFLNLLMILLMPDIVGMFQLQAATQKLATKLLLYHCVCSILIWPLAFALPNALRAANDVKFTMLSSIISMWLFRVILSFLLAKTFQLGVFGVWVAMTIDWVFRSILFGVRFASDRWKQNAFMK